MGFFSHFFNGQKIDFFENRGVQNGNGQSSAEHKAFSKRFLCYFLDWPSDHFNGLFVKIGWKIAEL